LRKKHRFFSETNVSLGFVETKIQKCSSFYKMAHDLTSGLSLPALAMTANSRVLYYTQTQLGMFPHKYSIGDNYRVYNGYKK